MPDAAALPTIRTQSKRQRKVIVELANKGLNSVQIAKATGLHSSTIRRFLDKIQPESHAVTEFRSGRADILATLQVKNLAIQERLLDRLGEEGLLKALTPAQITGMMFALNTQHGTLFDKERLERGQSTANHSLVTQILQSAVRDIYKPLKDKGTVDHAPREGAGSDGAQESPAVAADVVGGETGGQGGE